MGFFANVKNFFSPAKPSTSKTTTKPAEKLDSVTVTDINTGESVKTTTSPSGKVSSQTYRPAPFISGSGGGSSSSSSSSSTPEPIGEQKAIQLTNQESIILNEPKPQAKGKPITYGFEGKSYKTADGVNVREAYYPSQRLAPVKVTDSFIQSPAKVADGVTTRTITSTGNTSFGYSVFGDKTEYANFINPTGNVSTYAYNKDDKFAVSIDTGEIGVFKANESLPNNAQRFSQFTGERLYGEAGLTKQQYNESLKADIKLQSPVARLAYNILPRLTYADPLGIKTAVYTGEDIGRFAYSVGSGKGLSYYRETSRYNKQIANIYQDTYPKYVYGSGGEKILTTYQFTKSSPVTHVAIATGVGYGLGAVIHQATLLATTIPSVAKYALPLASAVALPTARFIASNAPIIAGGIIESYVEAKEVKFAQLKSQGGDYASNIAEVGVDAVSFAGSSYGFNVGLKSGFPVKYRGVQVEGNTISQGLYYDLGNKGYPIYTKTATEITATGKITYARGFGLPKKIVYPSIKGQYTPSGTIETSLYRQYVKTNLPAVESRYLESAYSATSSTYGSKAPIIKEQSFKQVQTFSKLSPEGQKQVLKFIKSQSDYQVYGSTSTSVQTRYYRSPKDIDVQFFSQRGAVKAKEIAGILRTTEGARNVRISGLGQIQVKQSGQYIKIFDIHGVENPEAFTAVSRPFGFKEFKATKISGVSSSRLAQEGINKLGSVGSLQPSGIISPDPVRRLKDVADFYIIQKELASTKIFGRASTSKALEVYKYSAVEKFGTGVFSEYKTVFAYSGSQSGSSAFFPSPSPSRSPNIQPSLLNPSSKISTSVYLFPSRSSSSSITTSSLSPSRSSLSLSSASSPSSISYSLPSLPSPSSSSSSSSSSSPSASFSTSSSSSPSPSSILILSSSSSSTFSPPPFPASLSDFVSSNIIKGGKKGTRYTPSFSALIYKIRGRATKGSLSRTGLNFRPITQQFLIKRRRRNDYF